MRYIPNSLEERQEMLEIVGLKSADELFRSIPSDVQLNRALEITEPLAEPEVIAAMENLAEKKHGGSQNFVFRRGRLFALLADGG
jgi:glycine dehydrogenase subunit 1